MAEYEVDMNYKKCGNKECPLRQPDETCHATYCCGKFKVNKGELKDVNSSAESDRIKVFTKSNR